MLSIPFVVVCLTLAIHYYVLYFVQLRIAKVKQTTTNGIDSTLSSLNDNYNFNRIARYVSMTLQGNAIPVVILAKADLCSNPGRYASEIENLSEQVKVHSVSALYGIGMDELNKYCSPEKQLLYSDHQVLESQP